MRRNMYSSAVFTGS